MIRCFELAFSNHVPHISNMAVSAQSIWMKKNDKAFTVLIRFDCLNHSSARTQSTSPLKDFFQVFAFLLWPYRIDLLLIVFLI